MVRLLSRLALVTAVALVANGCGAHAAEAPLAPDTHADPGERILRLRASARAISRETDGGHGEVELERVEAWTQKAESLFRAESDPSLRDLLLDTAEGELSALRARIVLARARQNLQKARAESSKSSNNPTSESPR